MQRGMNFIMRGRRTPPPTGGVNSTAMALDNGVRFDDGQSPTDTGEVDFMVLEDPLDLPFFV